MVSAAEEIRLRNIDRNRLFLEGLGLGSNRFDKLTSSHHEDERENERNKDINKETKILKLADTNILSVYKFREIEIKFLYNILNNVSYLN